MPTQKCTRYVNVIGADPATWSQAARSFYHAAEQTMANLYDRWKDEEGFENLDLYMKPLQPIAKKFGVKLLSFGSRPFGPTFKVDGKTYKLTQSKRNYSYQRIA